MTAEIRVVLMGPPGAGKGIQGRLLAPTLKVPHISSGDLFRSQQQRQTPLGLKAQKYMAAGLLVPDKVTIDIIMEEILSPQAQRGFIFDGFPRTLNQAHALDSVLKEQGKVLDYTLYIEVPTLELIKRLAGRLLCSRCQATYNTETQPPQQKGICNRCGSSLRQRDDDTGEAVERRLQVYEKESSPLVEYYHSRGKLVGIDGLATVIEVNQHLLTALSRIEATQI